MNKEYLNPFTTHVSYAEHVRNQLEELEIGKASIVDLRGKDIALFRSYIGYTQQKGKFKTKRDIEGNLWVMRIY